MALIRPSSRRSPCAFLRYTVARWETARRLAVGTLVAFGVAWLSIRWLLRYVAQHSFVPFGVYRIAVGLLMLALAAAGQL